MLTRQIEKTLSTEYVTGASSTESIDVTAVGGESLHCVIKATVETPAAINASLVTAGTDEIAFATAHGFKDGLKIQATTTTTLPAGLALSTDYYVIVVDTLTIQLATSYANALAGTQIDITDAGTGTHTITYVALAAASYTPQYSLDAITWIDKSSPASITVSTNFSVSVDRPTYRYFRLSFAADSGQLATEIKVLVKSNKP